MVGRLALALTSAAGAQQFVELPWYRVVEIGFLADDDVAENRALGINAKGQVGQFDAQNVIRSYGPCAGGGSGLSAPEVATWMAIGGEASIDAGAIDAAETGTALDAETPPARLLELYLLLIEEGMP